MYISIGGSACVFRFLGHFHKIDPTLQSLAPYNTHDTRYRNRRHKSTPFSGAGFRRRFFVPYTSGMKIYGAKINAAVSDVNDE